MSTAGLVGEDAFVPCPLQGGKLQVGVLVIGEKRDRGAKKRLKTLVL
jgi:hypothetical protein